MTPPSATHLADLRRHVSGDIITPGSDAYDDARRVWNAVFAPRPAVVVRPAGIPDIQAAIRFARDRDLELAVRGGGHSAVGHAGTEGGLVIDMSRLNAVGVDAGRRVATAQGGALLGQLDAAAQAHGLVCPVGVVGHTGVAGLTLGGGIGRLQRHFGLTIDSVRAVELVTADGRFVRASRDEEPELFWGVRGAGANFGVATSFELDLHPFGGTLHRSVNIHPIDHLHELWPLFLAATATVPDAVACTLAIGKAEPASDYPEAVAGKMIVVVSYNHSGDAADVDRDVAPLRRGPEPVAASTSSQDYLKVQGSSDLAFAWGTRAAIQDTFVADVAPQTLDACVAHLELAPGEASYGFSALGGAIARVGEDDTAFTGRTAPLEVSTDSYWTDPADDAANAEWVRQAMAVVATEHPMGRYVNSQSDDGPEMTRTIYGDAKLERLRALKRVWDPDNVFRRNFNIAS